MTEEKDKTNSGEETMKEAQRATLRMADNWAKSNDTLHHAIKSYEDVIRNDPESLEAGQARAALLKIAESWEKKGQTYAAAHLYKALMASR
jgi:hypothetical protein